MNNRSVFPHSASRWRYLLPLISLVLTACTLNHPENTVQNLNAPQWQAHQQAVKKITGFQTRGSFAYLTDKQKIYARFNWQQTASDQYRLLLTNPLGSTELQLDVQGDTVQLVNSEGKRYVSTDAEKMLTQLTGLNIPLQNLRQWMLGLPGDATHYTLDSTHHLKQINYRDNNQTWQVIYYHYDNKTQPALPAGLELKQNNQRIKLRMDNWVTK
ncbi:lipoprotein insertase outer membrane protein LolB [Enterobacteriaceae bacterium LUAb1]